MPLRYVIVDWGDDSPAAGAGMEAKYQNHKPRCQREVGEKLGRCALPSSGIVGSKTVYIGYACSSNDECGPDGECKLEAYAEDRFGDTSGQEKANACFEGYFQYKHTYTCAGEGSAGWNADKNKPNTCAFKVGVQVRDNWGWCNGDHDKSGIVNNTNSDANKDGKPDDGYYEYSCDAPNYQSSTYEFYDGFIYVKP